MTLEGLKQAIARLENEYGPEVLDMRIMASYDYGDYCHTQALIDFERVDMVVPRSSAYSVSGLAVPNDWIDQDDEDFEDPENEPIIALID